MSSKNESIKKHTNNGSDDTTNSSAAGQNTFPHRNLDRLYCPAATYLCAIGANPLEEGELSSPKPPCIPCAYKVSNFDIALDHEFTKLVPNQRPEQCPRSRKNTAATTNNDVKTCVKDGMMGYKQGMNVLTVGDGDFSFSLAVAKLVVSDDSDSGMVVATSYEDLPTLRRVYPAFDDTLNAVKGCGTKNIIGYKVDATQLRKTLPPNVIQSNVKFHRICWNFPCTAIGSGQDGQNSAMDENKDLVRKFMANALQFLDEEYGEIHMTHKTKPPYNQWDMETVAMEEINKNGNGLEFEYKGRLVFDKCNLHPYVPRKALDKKSFPCHDACVYIFGFKRTSKSTIPPNNEKAVFDLDAMQKDPSSSVIPVSVSLIETIRTKHLTLASFQRELKYIGKNRRPNNISDGNSKKRRKQRK
eukprot:scaffold2633_cov139-Skeletonema_menzelii.AAC.2